MKPSLSWEEQVALLIQRGLVIFDTNECARFLAVHNYYRFSGYMRYFQQAPHEGNNVFEPGTTFEEIREVYEADEALRLALMPRLARAEVLLRTLTAYTFANDHGPRGKYLEEDFYTDIGDAEPTVEPDGTKVFDLRFT